MAEGNAWHENESLIDSLKRYVKQNLKRIEIIDYMKRDFPKYPWSLSTLARRLKHFGISYIDKEVDLQQVISAVQKELEGPGKNLGYRAMHLKLRTEYHISIPRDLVADVMFDLDPDGVQDRNVKKKEKKPKKPFCSEGPGWTYSVDGHDKLMGFQNSTFPIAIYGCLDTFSRKFVFLRVWTSNSDPSLIGKFYMEFLLDGKKMPTYLRMDKGTETGLMGTIHTYLISKFGNMENPTKFVEYGPSTSNKIECWWKELHERMEQFIKQQCNVLLQSHTYDPGCILDRKILSYIFVPVVQRECNIFARGWNSHRIRHQPGLMLPTGKPDYMFSFPEKCTGFDAEDRHINVTEEALIEVGVLAELDEIESDFLSEEERQRFSRYFQILKILNAKI